MTAPHKVSAQSPLARRGLILLVVGLGLLVAGFMVYSLYVGSLMTKRYTPLADAAVEIKFEATIGHLWFEEIISGDKSKDIATVWEHLDQSAWYARAMLEGGDNPEGVFVPHRDPALRREIEDVQAKISDFRAIAEERWAAAHQSGIGSDIDQRFDAVFEDFLDQADDMETALQGATVRVSRRIRIVQSLVIALFLGLSIIIGIVFRRYERRQALDTVALHESEERYRTVAEETPVLICRFLTGGDITYANEACCKYFTKTYDELVGSSFFSLIPEADRETVMADIFALTVDSPNRSYEHQVIAPNGEIRWQHWINRAQFDAQGRPVAYQSIGEDITKRRQGEAERERLLQATMNRTKKLQCTYSMSESVCTRETLEEVFEEVVALIPPVWYYPEITRARIRLDKEEYVSEPFEDTPWKQSADLVVHGEPRGSVEVYLLDECPERDEGPFLTEERALLEGIARILSKATEHHEAKEELEKHSEHVENLVREHTIQLDTQIAESEKLNSAMVNVMEDLRASNVKLEDAGRELLASNKELDAFVYSVSHDLRAPLRHIAGFVDLLKESTADSLDSTGQRHLNIISESTERMGYLIDDLLAFSRGGREELHKTDLDLQELIKEVVREVVEQAKDRDIAWDIEALCEVHADRAMLRQVLFNLIDNAVKYTRERKQARIEIGRAPGEENELVVFVRDNGVGFDMQYIDKLFGVFQRLHSAEEFEGTGVGLANVRRIIHRHSGRTWAEGKVGEGATFYFSLPCEVEEE